MVLLLCHDNSMSYVYFQPNPCGKIVGDCAVRAVAKALDTTWQDAYLKIVTAGYAQCDVPSSNAVWGSVLKQNGFKRYAISNDCPDCYTAADFCREHPVGLYVLGFGNHVATVIDGNLYDAWNSSKETPFYYWTKE